VNQVADAFSDVVEHALIVEIKVWQFFGVAFPIEKYFVVFGIFK
jgi:hypothetical protein